MRQPTMTAKTQLRLFPASPQIQQCLREIDPQVVALLARLLRQHAGRKATAVGERPEGNDEWQDQAAPSGTESNPLCSAVIGIPGDTQSREPEAAVRDAKASSSVRLARSRSGRR